MTDFCFVADWTNNSTLVPTANIQDNASLFRGLSIDANSSLAALTQSTYSLVWFGPGALGVSYDRCFVQRTLYSSIADRSQTLPMVVCGGSCCRFDVVDEFWLCYYVPESHREPTDLGWSLMDFNYRRHRKLRV